MSEIITSTLPITVEKIGNDLIKNYQFYGQTGGIGVYDENLQSYKIPISVTNGQNVDNYSINIGDSKLEEYEYTDFENGKIYKRSPNNYIYLDNINGNYINPTRPTVNFLQCVWRFNPDMLPYLDSGGILVKIGLVSDFTYDTASARGSFSCQQMQTLWENDGKNTGQFQVNSDTYPEVSFRTFVKIGSTYYYGSVIQMTKSQIDTYPNKTVEYAVPPIVLPASASYPIITLNQGNNTLSSSISNLEAYLEVSSGLISNVQVDNQNYNLIDSDFYSMIANNYSSTQTYSVGDYCIYNHCLYKCIVAITTPENFNSNKWQQAILTDII